MFSAWFVVNQMYGQSMVQESFPLNSPANFDLRATIYLEPLTQGNNNQLILDSKYMQLSGAYIFTSSINIGGHSICYSIPVGLASGLKPTDKYFNVRFSTRQTGSKTVESRGELTLLNNPLPAGGVILRGSYIGAEWKLHVLDNKIATP